MGIAVASSAATGHDYLFSRFFKVPKQMTAIAVTHKSSGWDLDDHVFTAAAEAIRPLTVLAPHRLPVALMREMSQVGMALRGPKNHAAAMSPVAAVGSAAGRVFFAPEAQAAVAPGPSLYQNSDTIHEHGLFHHDSVSLRTVRRQANSRTIPIRIRARLRPAQRPKAPQWRRKQSRRRAAIR